MEVYNKKYFSMTFIKMLKTYLLYMMCVCAKSLQPCSALCNPMDCSLPGFSVYGIFQARILEWVAISSSRGSSHIWCNIKCIKCKGDLWVLLFLWCSVIYLVLIQFIWKLPKKKKKDCFLPATCIQVNPVSCRKWTVIKRIPLHRNTNAWYMARRYSK